jgi:hypothetical protein
MIILRLNVQVLTLERSLNPQSILQCFVEFGFPLLFHQKLTWLFNRVKCAKFLLLFPFLNKY